MWMTSSSWTLWRLQAERASKSSLSSRSIALSSRHINPDVPKLIWADLQGNSLTDVLPLFPPPPHAKPDGTWTTVAQLTNQETAKKAVHFIGWTQGQLTCHQSELIVLHGILSTSAFIFRSQGPTAAVFWTQRKMESPPAISTQLDMTGRETERKRERAPDSGRLGAILTLKVPSVSFYPSCETEKLTVVRPCVTILVAILSQDRWRLTVASRRLIMVVYANENHRNAVNC